MRNSKFALRPDGETDIEKLYTLFRWHAGEIAKREREITRCRQCFKRGFVHGKWTMKRGCDGCAEMHSFIQEARELFAREGVRNG